MKRMSIVAIIISILLSGCSKTSDTTLPFKLDNDGNYTGFSNLPVNYTAEQAKNDGYYVRVNLETVGGEPVWEDFIQDASNGKDTSIRIVNISDDKTYYHDLFYVDGYYRIFDSSSEDLHNYKFKYMLKLVGKLPNAVKSGSVTILTDDRDLSYKDVMWTFLSSDLNYSESISPFKIVSFE